MLERPPREALELGRAELVPKGAREVGAGHGTAAREHPPSKVTQPPAEPESCPHGKVSEEPAEREEQCEGEPRDHGAPHDTRLRHPWGRANQAIAARVMREEAAAASGHLQHDALDHVDHVFAAIGDRLHRLVQLLPLDHLDGVLGALEQGGELVAKQAVGFVLEPVHLDGVLVVEGRQRAQTADRAIRLLRRLHDDLGHRDGPVGWAVDLVDEEPISHLVDEVEHVVQPAGHRVDVLAVDRRDEGGVEPAHDLVGERVAGVLDVLDSLGLCLGVRIVEAQLFEHARRRHDVPGLLLEQVEEFLFARKQAEHAVTTSSVQSGGGRLSARPRWRRLSPLSRL